MDAGFPYGDIIVIGAVAAFIILRYRAMLGEQRGRDDQGSTPVAPIVNLERVVQLSSARAAVNAEKKPEDNYRDSYGSLAETLVAMRGIDREFAPDEFMQGAKAAYEMVIAAHSKRDRDTLKMLLSDALYQQFDQALKDEETARRRTDTTLIAINSAKLEDAKLVGNQATLTVDFVSEQVHLVRDETGAIVEGDASTHNKVEDRWVLTRDLRNSNPNWIVIET